MPKMVIVVCKNLRCQKSFSVRVADRKRGWGKYCSKSCKASVQNRGRGSSNNWRNSGVSRREYLEHAREYGGTPQFNRSTGEYEGFIPGPFSNEGNY